jgi:hypothetical protein
MLGIDTIILSEGALPEAFLRGCGVPDSISVQIPSLVRALGPIQFYSILTVICFRVSGRAVRVLRSNQGSQPISPDGK